MKIQNLEINKIKPYSNNPRNNKASIDKVASSIEEFGFRQPIVVDENLIILAGHTRLDASKKIGLKQVPVHIAKDLTEAQKKAFRIMDNKSSESSEWDKSLLDLELKDLFNNKFDLNLTGFTEDEIDALSVLSESVTEGLVDEDEIPEPSAKPVSKIGDVYELGSHRVMCGDSTNSKDLEKLMNQYEAKMIFTDPPFGIDYQDIKKES
jgi:ParB-like chromosome segregation protein Spo0J